MNRQRDGGTRSESGDGGQVRNLALDPEWKCRLYFSAHSFFSERCQVLYVNKVKSGLS